MALNTTVDALYSAIDGGADIINCSWKAESTTTLMRAIAEAYNSGILVVAAGGNYYYDGSPPIAPAKYDPLVLAVAGVNRFGGRYHRSNIGDYVDVSAPAEDIPVWDMTVGSGYKLSSGTSFAAPAVAAVAARLIQHNTDLQVDDLEAVIVASARNMPLHSGWNEETGVFRVSCG